MSLNNNFNIRRLERYLSVTYDSGATPVVVLTKSGLCSDVKNKTDEVQNAAPGVDVLAISSLDDDYGAVMRYILPGKTVAFIGSSGVGKSSLVNVLAGEEIMGTNGIREADSKGRHTTTHRQLIILKNDAMLIDTPGMRSLGMWDVSTGLGEAFGDVEQYLGKCRFADCRHETEPGCAIKEAIENARSSTGACTSVPQIYWRKNRYSITQ